MKTIRPAVLLLVLLLGGSTVPASGPKLPPQHTKAGLHCVDCHKEEVPTAAANVNESCMICHGDYPAMAAYTKALKINPHALPKGDHPASVPCAECHRQHQTPVVKCLECHPKFNLSPP